jgi:hypothetical protein
LAILDHLQEIRYWTRTGSVESFKDFIMNPHSIDYSEEENTYANYLAFRGPIRIRIRNANISIFSAMDLSPPK